MKKNTQTIEPNEQLSILPYSLIDYLANVSEPEVDKATRVLNTSACTDSAYIPKVKNAGDIVTDKKEGQYQVMHNGLRVVVDGYYGDWVTESIQALKGHHEPQEEKVFHEVLKRVSPNSWMIELGSYWSYYSLWFHKAVPGAHNLCSEPDSENRRMGERNAELNNFNDIIFIKAAAGKDDGRIISLKSEHADKPVRVAVRSVDSLMQEYEIDKLEMLHMDVQGVELDALKGAETAIKKGKLRFIFVSTHHYLISRNPNIHQECIEYIESLGGSIIAEHDIHESYSGDGLIVASFDERDRGFTVDVSRNRMANNQFRSYTQDLRLSFQAYDHILNKLVAQNAQLSKVSKQVKEQDILLRQYVKDIDHLNNLHIPAAFKEFLKSIKRSLKSRAIKLIWGKESIYQPSEELAVLARKENYTRSDIDAALAVIERDDGVNLHRLIEEPSRRRLVTYEILRHASHVPRRTLKLMKRGIKR